MHRNDRYQLKGNECFYIYKKANHELDAQPSYLWLPVNNHTNNFYSELQDIAINQNYKN